MSLFIVFILSMVFVINSKGSELTSDDYYLKDKAYQQEMEAMNNAEKYGNPVHFIVKNDTLHITFMSKVQPDSLTVMFMRPNSRKLDQEISIDRLPMAIPTSEFVKGNYEVRTTFYVEDQFCEQNTDLTIK